MPQLLSLSRQVKDKNTGRSWPRRRVSELVIVQLHSSQHETRTKCGVVGHEDDARFASMRLPIRYPGNRRSVPEQIR
jgi:hypothetical protein